MKNDKSSFEVGAAFVHGYCAATIDTFARGFGVPTAELAARVGTLLCGAEGGPLVGLANTVSDVRGSAATPHTVSRKVAVASGPPSRKTQGVEKVRAGVISYWAKMTPKQRAAENKRRLKKRLATLAAQKNPAKQAA